MKKALIVIAAICLLASTAWAQEDQQLKTDKDKYGYIMGRAIGQQIKTNNLDLDQKSFFLGIQEGIAGKDSRLDDKEVQRVITVYREKAMVEAQKKAAELAQKNKEDGDKFRAEFQKKEGVKSTKNGVLYRVIKSGEGKSPSDVDTVTTHYVGKLIDGTEFDSSIKRGEPATFALGGIIEGWREVVPLMKEGDKWEVVIPPELAYGPNGAGNVIGPNSTLVFELELLKVLPTKPEPKDEKPAATEVKPEPTETKPEPAAAKPEPTDKKE